MEEYDIPCNHRKIDFRGEEELQKVLEWQKRLDEWLLSHGATFKSVKHFKTLIGEPLYETWFEYSNHSAFDEDEEKAKKFLSIHSGKN